jgi:hypothetical protein
VANIYGQHFTWSIAVTELRWQRQRATMRLAIKSGNGLHVTLKNRRTEDSSLFSVSTWISTRSAVCPWLL